MPWDTPPPSRPPRGASPAPSGDSGTRKKKKKKSSKKLVGTPKKLVSEASVSLATHKVADALESHELEIYVGEDHLGLVLCDHPLGVMVQAAEPFDLAYMSGLRQGDVITTIQDRRVSRHAAAAAILFEQANAAERTSLFGVINRAPLRLRYHTAVDCDRFLLKRRSLPRLATIDASQGGQPGLTLGNHPLGVVVLDAVSDDLGARAGLCTGDVIVTLHGRAVHEHRVAAQLLEDCAAARVTVRMTSYTAEAAATELVLTNPFGAWSSSSATTATAHRPLTMTLEQSPADDGDDAKKIRWDQPAHTIPWDAKSVTASSKRDASALATYKYAAEPSEASISSSRRAASAAAGAAARAAAGTTAAAVNGEAGADNLLTPADASYAASWHEKEVIAGKLSEIVAGKKGARAASPAGKGGGGSSRGAARAWVRAASASSIYGQTIPVL